MDVKVTRRTLDKRANGLEKRVSEAVNTTADDVETYALVLAPERDGVLKGGISKREVSSTEAHVVSTAAHNMFVEYGTGRRGSSSGHSNPVEGGLSYNGEWAGMPAQPHMTPAVDTAEPDYIQRLKDAVAGE